MITITKPTYKCEHCSKLYQRKHFAIKHEKACSKNPENFRACGDCKYCDKIKAKLYINQFQGGTVETFYCSAKDQYLHPPKVEYKGYAYEFGDKLNEPMPKIGECSDFETSNPDLPF